MTVPPPRVFLTCAARSRPSVAPLLEAAEQAFIDLGWRTRVPFRAHPDADLAVRRRLRQTAYAEAARAACVIHVPGPAESSGQRLHRELHHAVKTKRCVLVLHARSFRDRNGIGHPTPERLAELIDLTRGHLVRELEHLAQAAQAALEERRGTQAR